MLAAHASEQVCAAGITQLEYARGILFQTRLKCIHHNTLSYFGQTPLKATVSNTTVSGEHCSMQQDPTTSRDVICSGFSRDSLCSNPPRQKQSSGKSQNNHILATRRKDSLFSTWSDNIPLNTALWDLPKLSS